VLTATASPPNADRDHPGYGPRGAGRRPWSSVPVRGRHRWTRALTPGSGRWPGRQPGTWPTAAAEGSRSGRGRGLVARARSRWGRRDLRADHRALGDGSAAPLLSRRDADAAHPTCRHFTTWTTAPGAEWGGRSGVTGSEFATVTQRAGPRRSPWFPARPRAAAGYADAAMVVEDVFRRSRQTCSPVPAMSGQALRRRRHVDRSRTAGPCAAHPSCSGRYGPPTPVELVLEEAVDHAGRRGHPRLPVCQAYSFVLAFYSSSQPLSHTARL